MPHGTGMPSTTVPATLGSGAALAVPVGAGGTVADEEPDGVVVEPGLGVGEGDSVLGLPSCPDASSVLHAASAARHAPAPPLSRVARRRRRVTAVPDAVAASGSGGPHRRSRRDGPEGG